MGEYMGNKKTKMSWQGSVDGLLNQEKDVDQCAIVDLNQLVVYGKSNGFELGTYTQTLEDETGKKNKYEVNELNVLKELVDNDNVKSESGIWMNKVRYHLITSNESDYKVFYLKSEFGGAAVAKTNKLILVTTWNAEKQQSGGNCNQAMDTFATHFFKSGY